MMKFSEKVFQLRKELRLSQEEVAEKLKVSRQTISNWENGSAQPTIDKAVELANLFDVSLDELVGKAIRNPQKPNDLLMTLLNQTVTIYLNPETDAWISVSRTELKNCEIIEVNPNSVKVIMKEKNQRIERLLFLKDIVGFEKGVN